VYEEYLVGADGRRHHFNPFLFRMIFDSETATVRALAAHRPGTNEFVRVRLGTVWMHPYVPTVRITQYGTALTFP
jgi:hypothetical protein